MIRFVLVEPAVPENVGAAARALKTMGFADLWIVNSAVHEEKQARIVAHGSGDILDNVRTFTSLDAVKAEVDLMVGTSAKPRHQREVLLTPDALKTNLADKLAAGCNVALVFGREDSGLHSHEIAQCDVLTSIPLAVSYPSLNLGQAVMLYAWALNDIRSVKAANQGDGRQLAALNTKVSDLMTQLDLNGHDKLSTWLQEHLPLLDTRSAGFLHLLIDRIAAARKDSDDQT